jgi:hypothetical protein
MGRKNQHSFAKRQREARKREKARIKREERLQRKQTKREDVDTAVDELTDSNAEPT